MKSRQSLFLMYLLALAGFSLLAFAYTFYKKNHGTEPLAVKDFPEIPLRNHRGEFKTINDYKGKTILVNFWFSACTYCLDEMKYFPELLHRYDDLVIMSVSIDDENHTQNLLKNKLKPWSFLVSDDPRWTFYNVNRGEKNGYVEVLQVQSFPTYFLIDKNGKMISSPRNAIFSVEQELGGLLSHGISLKNYADDYGVKHILKAMGLFHLLVIIILFVLYYVNKEQLKFPTIK